jgi:hypothetical protein
MLQFGQQRPQMLRFRFFLNRHVDAASEISSKFSVAVEWRTVIDEISILAVRST